MGEFWPKVFRLDILFVIFFGPRDAISAESLVRQLAVVKKDVPKLFTINVENKEEAYFSSLIASSKYKLLYQSKNSPYNYPFILLPFCERLSGLIVSVLVSRSSSVGLTPGREHCVVFLCKALYSHTQATQAQNTRSYILFFYFYANIQRNVTCDIYYYLTIELEHGKRDSRLAAYGGVVLQQLEGFNL